MKINKDTQRTARRLFHLCFVEGAPNEARLRTLIESIRTKKPRNHIALLTAIKRYVEIEENKHKCEVTSAEPLSATETAEIEQRIMAVHENNLNIEWKVDPALIAGLRIQIGDQVTDGSLKAKLERLQQSPSR